MPLPRFTKFVLSCTWTPAAMLDADLSALLLVGGKVRTDDDFVFYNQPASRDGAVEHPDKQHLPGGGTLDRITVDLQDLDPAVDSLVFVISLDGPAGSALAGLGHIGARLDIVDGAPVTSFELAGLVAETAAVTLELYRRDNWWKVRAVGQGYGDGLAGLARDFGVTVDETPSDAELEIPPEVALPPVVLPGAPPIPTAVSPAAPAWPLPVDWTRPPVPAGYEI